MSSPPPSLPPPFTDSSQLTLSIQPHHPHPPQHADEHEFLQKFESTITTEYQEVTVKEEPGTGGHYGHHSSLPLHLTKMEESYTSMFDVHPNTPSSSPQSGSSANSPCLPNKTFDTFFKTPTQMNPFRHFSQASGFSGLDLDSGIDFSEDLGTFSGSLSSTSSNMDLQLPDMHSNSQYDYELLDLDKFLTDPFAVDDPMNDTPIIQSMLSDPLH